MISAKNLIIWLVLFYLLFQFMPAIDKYSLNNCFVNNDIKRKPQYGFKLMQCDAHELLNMQSNDCNTVIFLTSGAISVSVDGKESVNVTTPQLFLIPNNSRAEINVLSNTSLIILRFRDYVAICKQGDLADYSLFRPKQKPNLNAIPLVDSFRNFLKTIEDVLSLGNFCSSYHTLKIKEFFFLLNAYYTPVELALLFDPLLGDNFGLKAFVYKNYNSVDSVNELVKKSGMSRTLFFEQFKKIFGVSVKQWMLQKKADMVYERLSEPRAILKEVMLDFGFSSASQFNRFCRVYLGDTPSNLVNSN